MTAITIDEALVRQLISHQFPAWSGLAVTTVLPGGWDNRTFRLGPCMAVRLPSAADNAARTAVEHGCLQRLAPKLPFEVPIPLALGRPAFGYPWNWSVRVWLEGEPLRTRFVSEHAGLAADVARFLIALQDIDASGGPPTGPDNFHRGGALSAYDAQMRQAIALLGARIDAGATMVVWEAALSSSWQLPAVWVHGDVSPGNLLMRRGRLSAVIDFGQCCVGDPACDLAIAWTLFDEDGRSHFRNALPLDEGTWARGRGWALWKAAVVAAGLTRTNAIECVDPWRTIDAVLRGGTRGSG